ASAYQNTATLSRIVQGYVNTLANWQGATWGNVSIQAANITGREGSGFVVEYVKDANTKDLVAKIKSHLDNTKPCSQNGDAQDHRIRWAFITYHQHSSGELLRVLHLSCNLHRSTVKSSGGP
ncbi:MAG TPA: hypothetical protein VJL59_13085, partial [Anaerolineales bacterium]|nr:hypothetical protein [Anaerolineales bacterium]